MLNGASALGILTGSSGTAAPNAISSLALFKQISKNEGKLRQTFFNRKDVQKDIETFKTKVVSFEDIDDLVKDRKTLQVILTAFDLGSEINNPGKIKAIIKSDTNDINSFANRLNDTRFAELAKFIDFNGRGFRSLTTASSQQSLIDKYLQNRFESDVGGANNEIAKAFFFLRNINSVTSTAGLLGNMQLRTIATTALRLPPQIASQSLEKQIQLIESKFDITKAAIDGSQTASTIDNQSKIKDDIQAIEVAKGQIANAESSLSIINTRLKNLRSLQINLPSHMDTSESGANDKEIAVQTSSVKQLKKIAGANSAAKAAIDELDPIIKQMNGLLADMRVETVQSKFDAQKTNFAELAALVPDLVNHTPRFSDPNSGENINLLKPSGGVIDAGQPNTYEAKKLDYAYQSGVLATDPFTTLPGVLNSNPFTTLSGTLGSNPFTTQTGTLGSNPYTVQSSTLGSNPYTTQTGTLGSNPFTTQTGTLGSNPYTVQSSTLGSNPYTVELGTLGSNPFTIKGGTLADNPWEWQASHLPTEDDAGNSIVKLRIANHGLQVGDTITVAGTENFFGEDLNGTYTVHSLRGGSVVHVAVGTDLGTPPDANTVGGGSVGEFKTNRVQVAHTGHPFSDDNTVTFSEASSVGGQSLNGSFTVDNKSADSYEFLLSSTATSGATGGGSSVTVNASDQVTVAHNGHPFSNGDTVTFSGGSSLGGLDLNASFIVTNATSSGYTITASAKAVSDATGGGGSVTVNASDQVTVAHTGHPFSDGDTVTFSGGASVGGVSLNGDFTVANASSNSYTITASSQGQSGSGGGGSVTVNASDQVTVTHNGHPFSNGDTVTFSGGSSVGGLDLNASFTVANATSNSYTITASGTAVSGVTGGGGSVGVNASDQVQVTHTGHPFSNGDTVTFSSGSSVGGLDLNASFIVANATSNSYTITASAKAVAGVSGGGGSVGVNASGGVEVTHVGHKFAIGDHVTLNNTTNVGGVTLDGTFEISGISANSYTIILPSQGVSGSGGGGTVSYGHSLANNPFATSNGSPEVTVTHKGHSLSVGDVITYSNGSAVGGLDLNKTFRVSGVSNSNTYTITAQSNATSTVNGGGGGSIGFVPKELSSIVDTVATSISAAYYDTGTFLTKISAAASAIASASLSDALEDSDAAKAFFTDAEIEFGNANRVISTNNSVFARETGKVNWGASLNTSGLSKGQASVNDAISRASKIEGNLKKIAELSNQAITSANQTEYVNLRADIVSLLETPGIITGTDKGTLGSNPFATSNGSSTVTVTHSGHQLNVGDSVTFSGASTVAGLDLNGTFVVASSSTDSYTFAASSAANSDASGGGGSAAFVANPTEALDNLLVLDKLGSNPFTTTSGSSTVTVEHTGHGFSTGDYVTFDNVASSPINGLRLGIGDQRNFAVTVTDSNHYTISAATLSDPLTTTAGSSTVSAEIARHGFSVNDTVTFGGGSAVGGLTLNGTFTVTGVTNANHFTFSSGSAASSSAKGGGTIAVLATGGGSGGGSAVTVKETYNIRPNPDGSEQLAVNAELRDIDSNGPYGLSDSTRLGALLPSALNSSNAADIVTGANTFKKNAETVRKNLQIDKAKFDFYANEADPQGAIDSELRKLKSELAELVADAKKDGENLIADFASDISIQLDSLGKKVTIEAQNNIKTSLESILGNHNYAVLNGEGALITTLGASPFATVKDSNTVTVTQTNHTFKQNDFVSFRSIAGDNVNGLDLNKTFLITGASNGAYTVNADTAATVTGSAGGSSVEVSKVTDRMNFLTDAKLLVDRAFSKIKGARVALDIELSRVNGQLIAEPEIESEFLKPLKNTDYAIKFIEKYLLMQDLAIAGSSIISTNNNSLALGLIKNIAPSNGLGLSVNFLS